MALDSLPAPPRLNAATRKLFPVNDDNRERETNRMLGNAPYVVHTSQNILQDMIDCGDVCADIRITKIEHYQRNVGPLHEFLVIAYRATTKPEVANYFIFERWGYEDRPEDPTSSKLEVLELDTDVYPLISGQPPAEALASDTISGPATPVPENDPASSSTMSLLRDTLGDTARGSIRRSSQILGKGMDLVANDRVVVSCRRDAIDMEKMEHGKRTLLATMIPQPTHAISVAQILCVASFVSANSPAYNVFDKSCFYYSRAIFDIARTLMRCETTDITVHSGYEFFKLDALKWGAVLFKKGMAKRVTADFGPEAVLANCNTAWTEFQRDVSASEEKIQGPLREEVRRREEEVRRREEEVRRREEADRRREEEVRRREEADRRREEADRRREEVEAEVLRLKALLASRT